MSVPLLPPSLQSGAAGEAALHDDGSEDGDRGDGRGLDAGAVRADPGRHRHRAHGGTPVLVIFSPVLVPAAIALALMAAGFVTSGGLGVAALSVFSWMYKYLTGKHPPGADQLDHAKARLASKARDIKEAAQHRIDQAQAS
ncbi:hypothetical protein OsI_16870 [Oryza sativa Indica Group]|uniref:Oleosin n=1 Tax=Oryza sativa subsp. indica TaxID=39946 RepID=B8ASP4_ORYSI|nr:hypothetical protein OsI_16870 [Oryza sativa Indica Group]